MSRLDTLDAYLISKGFRKKETKSLITTYIKDKCGFEVTIDIDIDIDKIIFTHTCVVDKNIIQQRITQSTSTLLNLSSNLLDTFIQDNIRYLFSQFTEFYLNN